MSRFTGLSEKSFWKNLKYDRSMGSDAITPNFAMELDSTDCYMQVLERLDF